MVINIFDKKSRNIQDDDEYKNSLIMCANIANEESKRLNKNIEVLEKSLKEYKKDLEIVVSNSKKLGKLSDKELTLNLNKLNEEISKSLVEGITNIKNSAEKKRKNLNNFTITLFGRTKAGKSTLREAITHGNGQSIGKGDQRTTKEIKEYYWDNLRIIDTPGISAYDGEEDINIAESIIDETDVILFLVTSDSIQESEFKKLRDLKAQNKPVIIILNVKSDLSRKVYLKRFLNNYEKDISYEGQKGHIQRILEFSNKYLQKNKIAIVPIHAMAAYRSTIEENEDLSKKLYEASKIEDMKFILRDIVINQGSQKRILTFRDDYIFYLNSLQNIFWDSKNNLEPRVKYIKNRYKDFKNWFEEFKDYSSKYIEKEFDKIYTDLICEMDTFIDDNIGNKKIEELWNNRIKELKIEKQINSIYEDLCNQVENYMDEFQRQINFDINNINFDKGLNDAKYLKKGVAGKLARWGSATLDIAFLFTLINIWNPAGWIAGVIGIGGAALSLFSFVFGSDASRFDKKKSDIKNKIKKDINVNKKKVVIDFKKEFNKNIINVVNSEINIELKQKLNILDTYLEILNKNSIKIKEKIRLENKSLFKRIYEQTFNKSIEFDLLNISRIQGEVMKILINKDIILSNNENLKKISEIMNEKIIYVEFTDEIELLIKRALQPSKVDNAIFEIINENITIKAEKSLLEEIKGENNKNIKLTKDLLDKYTFKLKEI